MLWYIYCYQVPQGQICMNGIFFKMGLKRFSFRDKHGVKLIDVIFLEIDSTFNVVYICITVNIHVILALAFLSSAAWFFVFFFKVINSRCHNSDLNYCI